MVLALLTEVVALHMRMAIVQVGIPGLERPIQGIFSSFAIRGHRGLVPDPFDASPHELLEKVIIWSGSGSRCRAWSRGLKTRSGMRSETPDGRFSLWRHGGDKAESEDKEGNEAESKDEAGGTSLPSKQAG